MQTRTGLLAAAGLDALNIAGLAEALDRIHSTNWDVAILCHTLSATERTMAIAALRRRNPCAPILLVARRSYIPAAEAEGIDLILSAKPAKMIAALRDIQRRLSVEKNQQREPLEAAG